MDNDEKPSLSERFSAWLAKHPNWEYAFQILKAIGAVVLYVGWILAFCSAGTIIEWLASNTSLTFAIIIVVILFVIFAPKRGISIVDDIEGILILFTFIALGILVCAFAG